VKRPRPVKNETKGARQPKGAVRARMVGKPPAPGFHSPETPQDRRERLRRLTNGGQDR
jgi:hypothetical protein